MRKRCVTSTPMLPSALAAMHDAIVPHPSLTYLVLQQLCIQADALVFLFVASPQLEVDGRLGQILPCTNGGQLLLPLEVGLAVLVPLPGPGPANVPSGAVRARPGPP